MTSASPRRPQQSVLDFKKSLKERLALFETTPSILGELAYLRSVRRQTWEADLDYYGNRKHPSIYKAIKEIKSTGGKVPRWNSPASDTSSYPFASRIKIERETSSSHVMHSQLRRSIVLVMSYLIDKCDLISGVCVEVRKNKYRELYVREIAHKTNLGRRTVQRALTNLTRHRMINRGVALIGITPSFYKALGVYSAARAMVKSLKALTQLASYRGTRIDPGAIKPHKHYHRFNRGALIRPSIKKLLASLSLVGGPAGTDESRQQKVPSWNLSNERSGPPPSTGPPASDKAARLTTDRGAGNRALLDIMRSLKK